MQVLSGRTLGHCTSFTLQKLEIVVIAEAFVTH